MFVLSFRVKQRNVRLALALLSLTVWLPGTSLIAQSWTWQTEQVGGTGEFISLAIDGTSSLHVSFTNAGRLVYGFRAANSAKWFEMAIANNVVGYTAIAVDNSDRPHLCYTTHETLRYAHWDGKRWFFQQIAPNSGQIAYTCSIAIASDGTPNIIWYQLSLAGVGGFFHLKHAALRDGAWQARTVDLAAETGKWNSLRLDAEGNPHVSYSAHAIGEQRYASWNGKSWSISTIEARATSKTNALHPGYGNSLVLTSNGQPLVSYMDETRLKFARQRSDAGWSVEEVDYISGIDWQDYKSSLVLDDDGNPHIAYQASGALKHAYFDGKEWRHEVIAGRGQLPARYPSMVSAKGNLLFIAYQDPDNGMVKVAVGKFSSPVLPQPAITNDK
jgi:hypothetical protein